MSFSSCSKSKEKTPDIDESTGKKIITITNTHPAYRGSALEEYINKFNKANDEYIAVTVDYVDIDLDEWIKSGWDQTVFEDAVTKLNIDMIAGNIPDVIFDPIKLPIYSYMQKGLLADMYELMDNDPTFNKDDYLSNAFTCAEMDGKLYEIFPRFWISGVFVKTSETDSNLSWTLDDFNDFISSKPNSKYILSNMVKRDLIIHSIQNLFNDYDAKEFNFDLEETKKILSIAERFTNDDAYDESNFDWTIFCTGAKKGDPLMLNDVIQNFRSLKVSETVYFGEDVTFKNFPATPNATPCMTPHDTVLITNNSKNQAGAWEFAKFIIDNPNPLSFEDSFPVKLSLLDSLKAAAKEDPSDNEKYTIYGNLTSYEIDNNTDEDNAKIIDIINSTTTFKRYDEKISKIIGEELDYYLSGQKSVDDFINVAQNRINLYISEMQ